jgi:hypothetical protein
MRTWSLLLLLLLTSLAFGQEIAATRQAQTMVSRVFNDEVIQQMADAIPQGARADFLELMNRPGVKAQLSSALIPIVAKHFTIRELEAQNQFDSSEIGQSILKKQLAFESEAKAALNRELSSAFREHLRGKQSQPK